MAEGPSLDDVRVASPCSERWDKMRGEGAVRHCDSCHMNVYNLSDMTREEATALLAQNEGRVCVRLYRRSDGTVLTSDCPVGVAKLRHAAQRSWARLAAAASMVIGALLSFKAQAQTKSSASAQFAPEVDPPTPPKTKPMTQLPKPKTNPTLRPPGASPNGWITGGAPLHMLTPKPAPKSSQ